MNKKSTFRSVANNYLTHPKKEIGITLIALVITIIILIILAGVSISLITGDNGIAEKAKVASTKYNYTAAKELIDLKINNAQLKIMGAGQGFTIVALAQELKLDEEIIIEEYYNEQVGSIKNGVTENLVNLKAIAVSTSKQGDYTFLIGKSCTVEKVTSKKVYTENDFITIAQFEDEELGKKEIKYTAQGYEGRYDGNEVSMSLTVETEGVTVRYSTDGTNWTNEKPTYTEVNEEGYTTYFEIKKDGYKTVSEAVTIVIHKAEFTVTVNKGEYITEVSGGGEYKPGDTVTVTATIQTTPEYSTTDAPTAAGQTRQKYSYSFVNWTGDLTSNSKSYSFTMPENDVTLTANGKRTSTTQTSSVNQVDVVCRGSQFSYQYR